jgi:hypothetical protein
VFRIVQKHQIRLPPEVLDRLFHSGVQAYGVQGVLRPVRSGEIADLGGDRELGQQVTCCPLQDLMRPEAEIIAAGVKCGDAEVQGPGQEAAFVTRPV